MSGKKNHLTNIMQTVQDMNSDLLIKFHYIKAKVESNTIKQYENSFRNRQRKYA